MLMALATLSAPGSAQGKRAEKPENVKAMMLAKFAAFLTKANGTKPAKGQPLRIGIVGSDATAVAAQKALPGRQVDGRTVEIVAITLDDAKAGRSPCELLYVAIDIEPEALAEIVAAHKALAVPLIAERKGFAASGGGIQLFLDGDNVRFQVNQEALKAQGVVPAPQFLNLSRRAP
ncbi:MAG: YfiR family protein [Planctomycetes bacterium]|nr:YfiR family protein [Planctomycetota bacterium]